MNKSKISTFLLVLIVTLSVFISVQVLVSQVPINSVPEQLRGIWGYVTTFFALAPVLTIIAFGRNIIGFLLEYFKKEYSEEYDFKKLGETLTLYIGTITTILSLVTIIPEPYGTIMTSVGAAVIVVLDLVRKQLEQLKKA